MDASDRVAIKNTLSNSGILLLELGFWQPIERSRCRKNHLGTDGQPHNSADYLTALKWADEFVDEEPWLESIIELLEVYFFQG